MYRAHNKSRLSIIDPNRPDNDISGGSSNVLSIFKLFSPAHDALRIKMDELHHSTVEERKGETILGTVLGGNYGPFETQRARLKELHDARGETPARGHGRDGY